MNKRILLTTLAAATLAAFATTPVRADDKYPSKPIELIVPASPGGGTDLSARAFARYAQRKLGKPVVIVNVTGAGGYTGDKAVHEAKPDGYKILYTHAGVVTTHLTGTAPFSYDGYEVGPEVVEDGSLALFTQGKSGIKTAKELISKAKAEPGKVKVATEFGAFTYFMLLKLQQAQGVKFNLVDVGSDSAKVTALLGGYVDVMPKIFAGTQAYIDSGDFNVLGVVQDERAPNAPKVPTLKEQGIAFDYPAYPWTLFFPKGTPQAIVEQWNKVAREITGDAGFKGDIDKIGMAVKYRSPADATKNFASIQNEFTELAKLKTEVAKQK
jgi:tripartite-type tricarboxylate transporter receptor subunit TctC